MVLKTGGSLQAVGIRFPASDKEWQALSRNTHAITQLEQSLHKLTPAALQHAEVQHVLRDVSARLHTPQYRNNPALLGLRELVRDLLHQADGADPHASGRSHHIANPTPKLAVQAAHAAQAAHAPYAGYVSEGTLLSVDQINARREDKQSKHAAKMTLAGLAALVFSPLAGFVGSVVIGVAKLVRPHKDSMWKQDKYRTWMQQIQSTPADATTPLVTAQITSLCEQLQRTRSHGVTPIERATRKALEMLRHPPTRASVTVHGLDGTRQRIPDYRSHHHAFMAAFRAALGQIDAHLGAGRPLTPQEEQCDHLLGRIAAGMRLNGGPFNASLSQNIHDLTGLAVERSERPLGRVAEKSVGRGEVRYHAVPSALDPNDYHEGLRRMRASEHGADKVDVSWGKFKGAANIAFDPMMYNLPHAVATLQVRQRDNTVKAVQVVRMGSPTRSLGVGDFYGRSHNHTQTTPEWRAYLRDCRRNGRKHLDIVKVKLIGAEEPMAHARLALADDPAYQGTLFTIALPDSGRLYTLKKPFAALDDARAFKQAAVEHMLNSPDYHLPNWLSASGDQRPVQELKHIFDDVHAQLFANKKALSLDERKAMLDVVYARIGILAAERCGADAMNVTCKDGIDRGAVGTNLILELASCGQMDPAAQERIYVSGAWQTKKQVPIHDRHERKINAQMAIAAAREAGRAVNAGGLVQGVALDFPLAPTA